MVRGVILDTGPLVAFLHAPDRYHDWARAIFREIEAPLLTCEAVLSEACFLLANWPFAAEKIGGFLRSGAIDLPFSLAEDGGEVFELMKRYANVPMSLADACIVVMSERREGARVLTLDRDFEIYRRKRRQKIPLLAPWSG